MNTWLPALQGAIGNAEDAMAGMPQMTAGAWIYMAVVWAVIIGVNVFCFARVFSRRN